MGWTFSWFLANETEVESALYGWKKPVIPTAPPQRHSAKNPFTGEAIAVWEYRSPPTPKAEPDADIPDYEELPHFTSRMDLDEVAKLLHLLTGRDAQHLSALLNHLQLQGPADMESAVHYVPQDLVAALAAAPDDFRALAESWTALDPEPDRWQGDEVDGRKVWLEQIVALARTAAATQRDMFVHWNS